jgi:ubiquinone/menaquinone biosynthesis C-methylase UbiE
MATTALSHPGKYVLATGPAAVRRLHVLHNIYSPAGRRVLRKAGLAKGMKVADFGCGVGVVTRMLSRMVGPEGSVTGLDINGAQLNEARDLCETAGLTNTSFIEASACDTGLPRNSFDLVYCRFLLLHLSDPVSSLLEMREVLKPGGILVVEDGDIATAGSIPKTAFDRYADLFTQLGPSRGVNYSLATNLYHLVRSAGFTKTNIEIHQPASAGGNVGLLLKWSVEESAPALVDAGLTTYEQLEAALYEMEEALNDPNILILAPRMSIVWARKSSD